MSSRPRFPSELLALTASPRVAIVGGGLGGLTVARQLNLKSPDREVDVEVFEATDRVGGVIESSAADGFLRESAANGVLTHSKGGAAELARDLGIEMVAAHAAAKKRWILTGGKLRELPTNPIALAKSDILSTRGKFRLLSEPLRSPLSGEPTVADFFRQRLGDEVHDRIVAPFVSGIYAGDTEELSMLAAFPKVSEVAARGGLFRGLIAERVGSRQKGATDGRHIAAPAGGMGAIVDRLAAKLGERIRLEEPIARIERSSRGVDIVSSGGRVEHFDAVVCAVPAHVAALMFKGADAELAELLATIPTAPIAAVHLGYKRSDVGHPLDGFGFLAAPSESLDVLGVVFESSVWPNRAPSDRVLVRVMIGGRRRPELVARSDSEILEIARSSCEEILAVRGRPVHENLVKWPRAIAQYTVGHRERLERAEVLAADQGVVLAGASYHGVAVNSVTADAQRAARRVHELLAAPLAMALWFLVATTLAATLATTLAACSGTGKTKPTSANDDGGAVSKSSTDGTDGASATGTAPVSAFSADFSIIELDESNSGSIEVSVIAPSPRAKLLASPGVNGCKKPRRGELAVHTLGGVPGSVVWLEDIKRGHDKTTQLTAIRQRLRECNIDPRVTAVGRLDASLNVSTSSESARELQVAHGADLASLSVVGRLPMTPIGRGFAVPMKTAGLYRVHGDGVDGGWAVVTGTPYIAPTDEKGKARLSSVPSGTYSLRAWHPPVAGASVAKAVSVTVEAGKVATVVIDLSSELAKIK